MIELLLHEIKDWYVRENFKKLDAHLNKTINVNPTKNYTDANRPMTGLVKGDTIFNTDDGQLNVWNGTQWTTSDGVAT